MYHPFSEVRIVITFGEVGVKNTDLRVVSVFCHSLVRVEWNHDKT